MHPRRPPAVPSPVPRRRLPVPAGGWLLVLLLVLAAAPAWAAEPAPQPAVPEPAAVATSGTAAGDADPGALPEGRALMQRVNQRPRGGDAAMTMQIRLEGGRGTSWKRVEVARKHLGDAYRTRYRIVEPDHELGIELLVGEDPELDEMWMYFPKADHLVRVASRGLSALATDFSCEDLKLAFPLDDYEFRTIGRTRLAGHEVYRVEMVPRTDRLKQELGFDRAIGWVRPDLWMVVRSDFYSGDEAFKTFRVEEVAPMDGVLTARRTSMVNHRADHGTFVTLEGVDYGAEQDEADFVPEVLGPADDAPGEVADGGAAAEPAPEEAP